jgi:hypothetical protein
MDMRTRMIVLWSGVAVLVVAGIVTLIFSFGGSKDTAVDDVNAIYTNAAATVAAQQQTLQAGMLSATPNPTLSSPTATFTPFPTPTFQQLQTPGLLPTIKPPAGTVVVTGCDNAAYVSDVTIPDGTIIPAGQYFTKTWKVSNIGSCAWTATYKLVFVSGDSLGGKATAIGKVVNPGESVDVSVELTSTSATGTITGTWRLSNDKGQLFGEGLTVVIKNGATTIGTVTITPTKTPTPTNTPIVIVVTATFTYTPTPTETPTPTPTIGP